MIRMFDLVGWGESNEWGNDITSVRKGQGQNMSKVQTSHEPNNHGGDDLIKIKTHTTATKHGQHIHQPGSIIEHTQTIDKQGKNLPKRFANR